jgi:hypothetical protein|tara:strand:- start:1786 stop:1944 length:159 start_codon:yes stop_codon:yes gene_type:complete
MSFGGGGGSSGITAHNHTNAAGEGGNLTTATLHPTASMTLQDNIFLKAVMFG